MIESSQENASGPSALPAEPSNASGTAWPRDRDDLVLNALTAEPVTLRMTAQIPVVVLAGGRSRRFDGDKLTARVNGRSVLARVVRRIAPLASEAVVVTSSKARQVELAPHLPSSVRVIHDSPLRWGHGPAAAMASARDQLGEGPILFVPGDVPWIETRALHRFIAWATASQADVAAPRWHGGQTEHLVQWQRDAAILSRLPWTRTERAPTSWRASEFLRAAPRTVFIPIAGLTAHPHSFSHITFVKDLTRPTLRGVIERNDPEVIVEGTPKRSYQRAHAALQRGDPREAARRFTDEARWYERTGLPILAQHAQADATRARSPEGRGTAGRGGPERAERGVSTKLWVGEPSG